MTSYKTSTRTFDSLIFMSGLVVFYYVSLLLLFSNGKPMIEVDYIFTGLFLVFIIIPIAINLFILVPQMLRNEKYVIYVLSFAMLFITTVASWSYLFLPAYERVFSSYFFSSYLIKHNIYLVFALLLISSMLLRLAQEWIYLNRSENRTLKLKNIKVETQLSALRSQIHPHFLFNSLNVIYALALDKNDQISSALVNLSDILRHVIYETDDSSTTLKQEVELLKAYIAFQKHRVEIEDLVSFKYDLKNEDYKIAPMLLLPLLENSFKHGVSREHPKNKILIEMKQWENSFEVQIKNNKHPKKTVIDDKFKGVGLEGLKTCLELLYANKHAFRILETEDSFSVELKLYHEL